MCFTKNKEEAETCNLRSLTFKKFKEQQDGWLETPAARAYQ